MGGFLSYLKAFGLAVVKIIGVVAGITPVIETAAPVTRPVLDKLSQIGALVMQVEAVFAAVSDPAAKTGSQKLKAATPLVAQVLQTSELVTGKKIKDEQAFIAAAGTITSGVADLLNSLGD